MKLNRKCLLFTVALLATTVVAQTPAPTQATTPAPTAPKKEEGAFKYEVALVNKQGHVGLVNTFSAKTLGFGRLSASIWGTTSSKDENFVVGLRPIPNNDTYNNTPIPVLGDPNEGNKNYKKTSLNLALAYGVTRFMDLAVMVPLYYDWMAYTSNGGVDFGGEQTTNLHMLGDMEASVKVQYPPYAHRGLFDLAIFGGLRFNTGNKQLQGTMPARFYYRNDIDTAGTIGQDEMYYFYSSNGTEVDMKMLWTWNFAEVTDNFPVKLHMNFGINWTLSAATANSMPFSTGFEVRPAGWLALYTDFAAEPTFDQIERVMRVRSNSIPHTNMDSLQWNKQGLKNSPLRITPGVQLMTPFGLYGNVGLAVNLANESGYYYIVRDNNGTPVEVETAVEPKLTLVASIGWNGFVISRDKDKDGIPDGDDLCPEDPEDFDGFNDVDGCPEADNDADGIADSLDKCPTQAEDYDGFEDEDGCPEMDNDADGLADQVDKCPNEAEDIDGFQDEDGCPEADNDMDGVLDATDQCPNNAEDFDGFQDTDGCPDVDNDMDGLVDSTDKCPLQPETYNAFMDEDGCPDEVPAPVVVVQEPDAPAPAPAPVVVAKEISRGDIVLRGVNFETGKAILKMESFVVLDDVVRSLREWPEVKLEIRGHTDSVGKAEANKRLSYNRAKSVMNYIISQGISETRLRAVGLGMDEPIADNVSAEGRAMNRRVEMRRVD